jgi:hypothetical protein
MGHCDETMSDPDSGLFTESGNAVVYFTPIFSHPFGVLLLPLSLLQIHHIFLFCSSCVVFDDCFILLQSEFLQIDRFRQNSRRKKRQTG